MPSISLLTYQDPATVKKTKTKNPPIVRRVSYKDAAKIFLRILGATKSPGPCLTWPLSTSLALSQPLPGTAGLFSVFQCAKPVATSKLQHKMFLYIECSSYHSQPTFTPFPSVLAYMSSSFHPLNLSDILLPDILSYYTVILTALFTTCN